MNVWMFLAQQEFWFGVMLLGLFARGIAIPLSLSIRMSSPYRFAAPLPWFIVAGPAVEELVFRLGLISLLLMFVDPIVAIAISTIIYMIYGGLIYGPGYLAHALVIGALFGLAMFELPILFFIAAHYVYRMSMLIL